MAAYHPFVIHVGEQAGQVYPVIAEFQGIERSGEIPASLPLLKPQERDQVQTWLKKAYIDRDYAKDLGSRLFYTLFPPPVAEMFREAGQRIAPGDRLRIVLNLPLPEALADLPWELIYDAQGEHGFLARSGSAPLVRRYTDVAFPHQPPQHGPLRVLVVTASPPGAPPLSTGEETEKIVDALDRGFAWRDIVRLALRSIPAEGSGWQRIRGPGSLLDLLRRLLRGRRFEVAPPLHHATRDSLQERLAQANSAGEGFHVIHFIGHGQAGPDGGTVLLEGQDGPDPVPADEFAEIAAESTVNLVMLNACETASANNLFQSVAQATVRRGVPAVIGMQVPVLDRAAVDFAHEFYSAWAAGEPIEVAVAHARRLIRQLGRGGAADWSIPTLYMGHTGGLTPQPLARAHRLPWQLRLARGVVLGFIGLLIALGALLGLPNMIRTLRTEAPVLRCIWPYPMDETKFTIAFNEFAVVDAAGGPLSRNDGRALADFLFERFAINFEEIGLHLPYELRPPAHTCPIRGRTSEERSQVAAEMAGKINADIIIYGVITDTAKPQVALEFYVGSLGFEEGEEIAGPYALGDPLPIDLPFRAQTLKVIEHPPHLVRTDVLSLIALGLSYYAADNPTKALEYYTQAEQNDYWPRTDGKEIIYLLLGNAMLRQASVEFTSATLSAARDNYQQALEINPGYARAKVGEAVTLYMMALGDPDKISAATLDREMLQQALTTYQEALAIGQAAGDAEIEPKVHAGLGQIYFVQGLIGQAGMIEQAKAEMQWVVDAFEQGDTHLATRAGYAHGYLGTIATVERDTDGAIAQFQQAVKMATPFYQSFYYTRLGNVYCEKGQTDLALAAYQDAIDRARLYGYRQKVEDYTAKLEEMRGKGCP